MLDYPKPMCYDEDGNQKGQPRETQGRKTESGTGPQAKLAAHEMVSC